MAGAAMTPLRLARSRDTGQVFLQLEVGFEHEIADALLRGGIGDRAKQREGTTLAVNAVLTRGKRDVATAAGAALPDREAD
jgi:hypothetical protein